jgi:hypothetical protein
VNTAPPEPAEAQLPVRRRRSRRTLRVSSFGILAVAFVLLMGAAAAAIWGQLKAGKTAPVVSMTLSAAAVVLTALAIWLRPTR